MGDYHGPMHGELVILSMGQWELTMGPVPESGEDGACIISGRIELVRMIVPGEVGEPESWLVSRDNPGYGIREKDLQHQFPEPGSFDYTSRTVMS